MSKLSVICEQYHNKYFWYKILKFGAVVSELTDINGEFSGLETHGYVSANALVDSIGKHASGIILTHGQQVNLDINSQKTCRVSGIAYDQNCLP